MYIAHRRDTENQTVLDHLLETAALCAAFAKKIGMENTGFLAGSMHDFGKFSQAFQNYIQSAEGLINPDEDAYIDAKKAKGKIDHSTAGAQCIHQALKSNKSVKNLGELAGQIVALCIASHHSGMIDTLATDYTKGNLFEKRMRAAEEKSHLEECRLNQDEKLKQRVTPLLGEKNSNPILTELVTLLKSICASVNYGKENPFGLITTNFHLGFLTRFLFSCLIDADRLNSAEFADPKKLEFRSAKPAIPNWSIAITRVEDHLSQMPSKNAQIDKIRQQISNQCMDKAYQEQGIYSLTVPTGGGKTLATLRYALHHAKQHQLEHIFFIIPFTSIIEQNAEVIRNILETKNDQESWVLEHHSSLEPEQQTWQSKLNAENWDSPIIVTTMVQFLQALFEGGTSSVRRLHHLAKSVLIFDEIQTLPINCTRIFCNALNFLVNQAQSTAILCTATQPLLNRLPPSTDKGQLKIKGDLITDVSQLFADLKRVNVNNYCKALGWTEEEIVDLALKKYQENSTCLVIVNTKQWAQYLYQACENEVEPEALFHLSTNQCVMHRKHLLKKIKARLEAKLPVLCFSTQLIEAGVDVDFACVIRFLAGLDSIAQAAGRCNRNGLLTLGQVYVVNPADEKIDVLEDIKVGKEQSLRIFNEDFDDALKPDAMTRYFEYFFYQRADDMDYPCKDSTGEKNTLLKLLSTNQGHPKSKNGNKVDSKEFPLLEQSFAEAGRIFKAIDAPTQAVIVPYVAEGENENNAKSGQILNLLMKADLEHTNEAYFAALKQAQQYSVNVFPNIWRKLLEQGAVFETQKGSGIYCLEERYYHADFGLTVQIASDFNNWIC